MGRIKSIGRSKSASKGLAPKSNLYVRNKNSSRKDVTNTRRQDAEVTDDDEDDIIVLDYPSPPTTVEPHTVDPNTLEEPPGDDEGATVEDTLEIAARIRKNGRKKYPSVVPRASRPPYLPPVMQTGCILTTKFKCLSAPTATEGKPAWDAIKYCLDCLRPHLILHCNGDHDLEERECDYHIEK
jgi:hypothetical protein